MAIRKRKVYKPREVDVDDFYDVRNTAMSLRVSESELLDAIKVVGPILSNIKNHLGTTHLSTIYRKKM